MIDDDLLEDFEIKKKKITTQDIKDMDKTWIYLPRDDLRLCDITIEIMDATAEEFCLWLDNICPTAFPGSSSISRDPEYYREDRVKREKAFMAVMASLNRVGQYIKG